MILKRVGPLSVAKIVGSIYFCFGLIIGLVLAVLSVFGAGIAASATGESQAWLGVLFGVGAVIFLPVLYGSLTFLVGLLVAAIYNLAASFLGGVELHLE